MPPIARGALYQHLTIDAIHVDDGVEITQPALFDAIGHAVADISGMTGATRTLEPSAIPLAALIDLTTMRNLNDQNNKLSILDLIHYSIQPLSDSVSFLP